MPPRRRQTKAPAHLAANSAPPAAPETAAAADAPEPLPQQEEFYRAPARFGNVPVARQPMGWDPRNPGFRNHYPIVNLPTQIAERVPMGNPAAHEPNRLIWGDNLHVMRQIDTESVDLIYIDPPFFSGRNYNVMWGDNNERRSFEDIWEGGLDGYLLWLNARLYEMKRILKPTGSIYVHCDWHASHYIKVEMDKIFGYGNFLNEIVWPYRTGGVSKRHWPRKHDILLMYVKSGAYRHKPLKERIFYEKPFFNEQVDEDGRFFADVFVRDTWDEIKPLINVSSERIGYPTQKPEALVDRIIQASSDEGDVVLDAFVGGGTSGASAMRLGRRFLGIDQSRVAIAVTAERLKNMAETRGLDDPHYPDFTIEQWGVYDAEGLAEMPPEQFRKFILDCYDARIPSSDAGIHGYKGTRARTPVWVGLPSLASPVTAEDVDEFAHAIIALDRYRSDEGLRDGVMLAWGFSPEAREAAQEWRENEQARIAFVRLEQFNINSGEFRQHIQAQSTTRGDYSQFLVFAEPPDVVFSERRLKRLHYEFNAEDSSSQNPDGKIVNVQWDFDYNGEVFHAAPRPWQERNTLKTQHTFPRARNFTVACRMQDDKGGEGMFTKRIRVS